MTAISPFLPPEARPRPRPRARLGLLSRAVLGVLFAWTFLHPSLHFYLGQFEIVPGAYGVTAAGLIDVLMFGFAIVAIAAVLVMRPVARPYLFLPVLIYLGTQTYALLISPFRALGLRGAVVSAVPPLFYLATVMWAGRRNHSVMLGRLVILSSIFPMIVALAQLLSPSLPAAVVGALPATNYSLTPYPGLGVVRVSGSLNLYNPFAIFMGLVFLAVLFRVDYRGSDWRRWLWLAIGGLLIFATFTRAVWFSLVALSGLAFLVTGSRTRAMLGGAAMAALAALMFTPAASLFLSRLGETNSLEQRAVLRARGLELFARRPAGYGLGTSQLLTSGLFGRVETLRGGLQGGTAFHNEYVTHLVEGGLPSFLAYLGLLVSFVWLAWRIYRLGRQPRAPRQLGLWLGAATLFLGSVALTDAGFAAYGSFAFWMLVAAADMEYRALRSQWAAQCALPDTA